MSNDQETTELTIDIEITETAQACHVRIRGALDADAAPRVSREFERLIRGGHRNVRLDLRDVTMISSAGVGSLIAGVGECRDDGGAVVVDSMSSVVRHVLEMLDLLDYFQIPPQNG